MRGSLHCAALRASIFDHGNLFHPQRRMARELYRDGTRNIRGWLASFGVLFQPANKGTRRDAPPIRGQRCRLAIKWRRTQEGKPQEYLGYSSARELHSAAFCRSIPAIGVSLSSVLVM